MSATVRIGILGGTFDPIHRGHLEPVREIAGEMGWDRILVIPAFRQPFKEESESASGYHRFAMAVLACEGDARFRADPIELERGETSYSVDTLEALRGRIDGRFDWIIGDDQLADLERWRSIDRILELANFVVLRRGGNGEDDLPRRLRDRVRAAGERGDSGAIVFAANAIVPVSATGIRQRIREGERVGDCLDRSVADYIERVGLYGWKESRDL